MADIYFHIGLHKTGTTFLQREVFPKIKGIDYYGTDQRIFEWPEKITQKTLVSRERLSGNPYNSRKDDRLLNLEYIKYMYPNAKIIVVFRNLVPWVRSLYSTYVKDGGTLTEWDWHNEIFNWNYLNQGTYITWLYKIFGIKNILILHYDNFKENNWKFVKSICDFMDVDVPLYENKIVGKRLSKNKLKLLRLLNHLPIKRAHLVKNFDKLKLRGKI